MYIPRQIEKTIDRMLGQGKVVLLTGPRQVGKTTVLKKHLTPEYGYVSMEDPLVLNQAKDDAVLFFSSRTLPLVIDEIQRIPELFSAVKWLVDQSEEKGRIVLTGSQTYRLMKGVSESLAGRIRILEMPGLSLRELVSGSVAQGRYVPHLLTVQDIPSLDERFDLWWHIHRGSMPELQDEAVEWDPFYMDYVRSYLERDVRDLINVRDESKFYKFMVACAARSGQLFNATDVANVVEVDRKTVTAWLSVLESSGIVHMLQPFWSNVDKRMAKTPKLYFMDTGLVCHLTRWTTPEQLKNGAVAGHVFETFVVSEILKAQMNSGANLHDVWFYRDSRKREVDVVIQDGRTLHPIEIKMGATIGKDAVANFSRLDAISDYERGFGHVICQCPEPYAVTSDVQAIPVHAI